MPTLVIAEHDKTHLRGGTANAVTAAAKMGGEVHLLVAGSGARAAADEGAKLSGVTKVLHVDAARIAHFGDPDVELRGTHGFTPSMWPAAPREAFPLLALDGACIPLVAVLPVEHPQLRPNQTRTRGRVSGVWLDETPIAIGAVPAMHRRQGWPRQQNLGTTSD